TTGPHSGTSLNRNPNAQLRSDSRYWAAITGNDNSIALGGVSKSTMFFWGATGVAGQGQVVKVWSGFSLAQNYGPLPDPAPITGTTADLTFQTPMPAIVLAFSAVT